MSLELARAFVRVQYDRAQIAAATQAARRQMEQGLSGVRVNVDLNYMVRSASRAGASAGRAWRTAFQASAGGGMAPVLPLAPRAPRSPRTPPGGGGGGGGGGNGMPVPAPAGRGGRGGRGVGGFVRGAAQTAAGVLGYRAVIAAMSVPVHAVQDAAKFEQEMIRIKTATEASADEMERLEKAALKIGSESMFKPTEVAHAMRLLAEKGLNAPDTLKVIPDVLNFAQGSGGKVNVEQSADVLVGIMNSMEIGIDGVTRAADVLTRAALKSSTDVHELGDAFKYVGPLAELAGMSIEETAAMLSVLSQKGLGGSLAGTGTKRIIASLVNPKTVEKLSGMVGASITTRDASGRVDVAGVVDQVNAAMRGRPDSDKVGVAQQVFGERAGPQFAALLQEGGDAIRKFTEDFSDSMVTAESASKATVDSLEGSWKKLGGTLEALGLRVIDPLVGSFQSLAEGVAAVVNWNPELTAFVVQATAGATALAGAVKVAGYFVAGLKAIASGVAALAAFNPVVLSIGAALLGVVTLMSQLVGDGDSFGARFTSFFGKVADFIAKGVSGLRDMLGLIDKSSGDEPEAVVPKFVDRNFRKWQIANFPQAVAPDSVMGANKRFNPKFADSLAPDAVMGGPDEPKVAIEKKKEKTRRREASFTGIEELSRQLQVAVLSKEDKIAKDNLSANKETAKNTKELLSAIEGMSTGRFG